MSEINCFGDEVIYNEVVPGWFLVQLINLIPYRNRDYIVNGFVMGEGDFGLTRCNDPDFIFSLAPMLNPIEEDDNSDLTNKEIEYFRILDHYRERLTASVDIGYELVVDCIKAGYNPEEDGALAGWLMEKMFYSLIQGEIRRYEVL